MGALQLRLPDGRTLEASVTRPALTLGRTPDNDVVVEEVSIARRHLRLTFEAGRMLAEDLGSSYGTYIGPRRLVPNVPSVVGAGEVLRAGHVEVRYFPTPEEAAAAQAMPLHEVPAPAASPDAPMPGLTLIGPEAAIAPGTATAATVLVHNPGPRDEEYDLAVAGLPAEWFSLDRATLAVPPGAQQPVTLSFHPPRLAASPAGAHVFTVLVTARHDLARTEATGELTVLPFQALRLSLQPVHGRREFYAVVHNDGNAPAQCALTAFDETRELVFAFEQNAVTVPPGEAATVGLRVTPAARRLVGPRQVRAFTVVAQPAEQPQSAAVTAGGYLITQPPIPAFMVPVAVLLSLGACIVFAWGYFTYCPRYWPGGPGCPAAMRPAINVFTSIPAEIDSGQLVVITWDVSNAERIELVAPEQAVLPASGVRSYTLTKSALFTLRASNAAGPVQETITVTVRGTAP
jgi:hypothetical protein